MRHLMMGGEGCRMHTDIFTLAAQELLFNISQRNMQEHWPAVWTGKRHGGAGQVVQQRPNFVVMQVLMGTYSAVTRHHGQETVEHPGQTLIEDVVGCRGAQDLEDIHQGCRIVAFRQHGRDARETICRPPKVLKSKAQGGKTWQTRGDPLWVSGTKIKHGRKQDLLCGEWTVMHTRPQALIEHALVRCVLINQEYPIGILQHNVGVVELSQRHAFENRAPGFWVTGVQVEFLGDSRCRAVKTWGLCRGHRRGGRRLPQHRHSPPWYGESA